MTQTTYKSSQIAQQTKYITTVCPVWFKDSFKTLDVKSKREHTTLLFDHNQNDCMMQ